MSFVHKVHAGRTIILFAASALGFAGVAVGIGFVIDAPHLFLLRRHHAQTTGKVTRLLPNSHGAIEFTYSVDGATYSRITSPYGISRVEGLAVPVYYYPDDPRIAFTAPAGDILDGQLPSWIAAAWLGALFGFAVGWSLTTPSSRVYQNLSRLFSRAA
jgi:hypothetical protein